VIFKLDESGDAATIPKIITEVRSLRLEEIIL